MQIRNLDILSFITYRHCYLISVYNHQRINTQNPISVLALSPIALGFSPLLKNPYRNILSGRFFRQYDEGKCLIFSFLLKQLSCKTRNISIHSWKKKLLVKSIIVFKYHMVVYSAKDSSEDGYERE